MILDILAKSGKLHSKARWFNGKVARVQIIGCESLGFDSIRLRYDLFKQSVSLAECLKQNPPLIKKMRRTNGIIFSYLLFVSSTATSCGE
jgi:hypothetical protein